MVSVANAHDGRDVDMLIYELSQVISIAWLRVGISRRLMPPSDMGRWSLDRLIGGERALFHMKSLIIFVREFSICFGIPWAFVRNCVIPPTNI
jgi:hypothetical protein